MATVNRVIINNYSLEKVLDQTYTSTTEYFSIIDGTYVNNAGVFIIVNNIAWQANMDSSTSISVVFSKENLESIGFGRWPFEIRTTFTNGHVSTLVKGDIRIIPFA